MNRRSHEPWSANEEYDLTRRFRGGASPSDIASAIGRSELAVRGRLAKLRLIPPLKTEEIAALSSVRCASIDIRPGSNTDHVSLDTEKQVMIDSIQSAFQTPSIDVQQAFRRFHFVYGLVNPRGHVYVGYAADVWHRIGQHNRDLGAVATRNNGPWFPFAIYCFAAEADARAMETSVRRNFSEFALRTETSLKEVLAQIGIPMSSSQLTLL